MSPSRETPFLIALSDYNLLVADDGDGAAQRSALRTKVCIGTVAVVDLSVQTVVSHTLLDESVLDSSNTVLAEASVDLVVTSVVVGPTGEGVALVLVEHDITHSVDNVVLDTNDLRNVDGEVNDSQRSLSVNGLTGIGNGFVKASLELTLEVSDLAVGSSQTSSQCVALSIGALVRGANGNDGSSPLSLVELIAQTKECRGILNPSTLTSTINMLLHIFVERNVRDIHKLEMLGGEIFDMTCRTVFGGEFEDMLPQPTPEMEKMRQMHEMMASRGMRPTPEMIEEINRMIAEGRLPQFPGAAPAPGQPMVNEEDWDFLDEFLGDEDDEEDGEFYDEEDEDFNADEVGEEIDWAADDNWQ